VAIRLGSLQVIWKKAAAKTGLARVDRPKATVIAAIFLTTFFWIEFTASNPLIICALAGTAQLRDQYSKCFTGVKVCTVRCIFCPLLSPDSDTILYKIGEVIMWLGLPQLLIVPLVPR